MRTQTTSVGANPLTVKTFQGSTMRPHEGPLQLKDVRK